jgi:hypothetical protein
MCESSYAWLVEHLILFLGYPKRKLDHCKPHKPGRSPERFLERESICSAITIPLFGYMIHVDTHTGAGRHTRVFTLCRRGKERGCSTIGMQAHVLSGTRYEGWPKGNETGGQRSSYSHA